MTGYANFTEHNEWEGETWHFWIPIAGNEDTLQELHVIIADGDGIADQYELDLTPVPEAEVDSLVAYCDDDGYLPDHIKLAGTLVITEADAARIPDYKEDPLYKGGIRGFMHDTTTS